MEQVDQSIASQNAIVAAIGGKLKTLKMGIAASKKKGDDTLLTVPPLVKGINESLDTIKKMLDEAKNIKKSYMEANSQLATLGRERAQVSKDLEEKTKQIAELNKKIEELTKKQVEVETANQQNRSAKERAEASFIALQQQSTAATQQQQAALQAAMQEKTAAAQKLSQTEASLGTSQEHARKMQEHMNKLGDLKKHQADLTAALNALSAEIDAANDDMTSLDKAHVEHLGAIKDQLQRLDQDLRTIITSNPTPQPPAAGSGGNVQVARAQAVPENVIEQPVVDAEVVDEGNNEPARRKLNSSLRHVKTDELGNIVFDNDGDSQPNILRGTTDEPGTHPDENVNYLGAPRPHRQHNALSKEEEDLINQGLSGTKQERSPFARSVPGTRSQRGGYIAIKKTRSKSSSSGRRGTRRRSSSRSSSTRRKRHRGTSSSSTRSSRR